MTAGETTPVLSRDTLFLFFFFFFLRLPEKFHDLLDVMIPSILNVTEDFIGINS